MSMEKKKRKLEDREKCVSKEQKKCKEGLQVAESCTIRDKQEATESHNRQEDDRDHCCSRLDGGGNRKDGVSSKESGEHLKTRSWIFMEIGWIAILLLFPSLLSNN